MAALELLTIGHSTHPIGEFLALLREFDVQCVVDVRRCPGSRTFPQYDRDALADSLKRNGIGYWQPGGLGGRHTARELAGLPADHFWRNPSFARYASWTHGEEFSRSLAALLERSCAQRCALMCSEAVWWRCHRRIIADHLLAHGRVVSHILGSARRETASDTGCRDSCGCVGLPGARYSEGMRMKRQAFKPGDHVRWHSEAGYVSGRVTRVHRRDFTWHGYTRHCSADEPQYEIKSDKTDHVAVHKGSALQLLDERT